MVELSLVDGERRAAPPEMAWADTPHGTLFVLVELSAPADMWDDVSSLLVDVAVEAVTLAKGSVTAALHEAAQRVNRALLIENERLPPEDQIWAGLNLACQQGETLFLAQAGPALTYIARGARVTRFPKALDDLQAETQASAAPLGDDRRVHVRLARFTLKPGDLIVLSASHLPSLASESAIHAALTRGDVGDTVEALASLVEGQDYSALALQVGTEAAGPRVAEDVVTVLPEVSRTSPTPVQPPVAPKLRSEPAQADMSRPRTSAPSRPRPRPQGAPRRPAAPAWRETVSRLRRPLPSAHWGRTTLSRLRPLLGVGVSSMRHVIAWGMWGLIWVVRLVEGGIEVYRRYLVPAWRRVVPWLDALAIEIVVLGRALVRRLIAVVRHTLPGTHADQPSRLPPKPRPQPSPEGHTFYPLVALVFPLLLIAVAVGLYWRADRTDVARFEELVTAVRAEMAQVEQADPQAAGVLLLSMAEKVAQAEALRPGSEEVSRLREQLRQLEARLGRIRRVRATQVAPFSTGADPAELVYADGVLYVLDLASGALFRATPDDGETLPLNERAPLAAPGLPVSGRILFITWMPPGGTRGYPALVALAEGGAFEFAPERVAQPLRRLNFVSLTGELMDVGHYNGNLYVLDRTENQIWKYIPDTTGGYGDPPIPWMKADTQAAVQDPIRLAIDGDIYVLEADGDVIKMTVGEQRPFELETPVPPLSAPVALFTDEQAPDVPLRYLYVAEADRVLVFDKQGQLVVQFWPEEGQPWGEIRDLTADEPNGTLYLLTTTGIWRVAMTVQQEHTGP
ncbi:MAG: hypothetical protein Q9O62_04715 [Ardenticatenia bacterium]|nr:hypothetical protein [Ardenticatenia bacterium]